MLSLGLPAVRSVLCIGSHADDIEIGCGGTMLRLLGEDASIQVHWVVVGATEARADEATRSARRFLREATGASIVVKGFRDSVFPLEAERIKGFFEDLRQQVTPDLIFSHRREDLHQDHRVVAELTWCTFRNHLILEYEIPKYEGDLGHPNVFVPLAEGTCRQKVETIVETFETQRDKPWFSADTFWALLRLRGIESNSPTRLSEGFHCRKLVM